MTYIIGLVVIGLFFLALHYFTDLDHTQKWWITTMVLSLLAMAIMFNEYQSNLSKKTRSIAVHFNQGKEITCEDTNVSNKFFTLSVGTYTFIGNENTPNAGEMISVADCE